MRNTASYWLHHYRRRRFQHGLIVNALFLFAFALFLWLVLWIAEVNFYFPPRIKSFLVFGLVMIFTLYFLWKLVWPAFQGLRGKGITLEDCALELGRKFPELDDKLLNAYQLEQMGSDARIQKAVQERLEQALRFPLWEQFSWKTLRPYLGALTLLTLVFAAFEIYQPTQDAQKRLLAWNESFTPPPPFEVVWQGPVRAEEGQNVEIRVRPVGVRIDSWSMEVNGIRIQGVKQKDGFFVWTHRMGSEDQFWSLIFGDYLWTPKRVESIPAVFWKDARFRVVPPEYTGDKILEWNGLQDIECPAGSVVHWEIDVQHASNIRWKWIDSWTGIKSKPFKGTWVVQSTVRSELFAQNALGQWRSGGVFHIRVRPDLPPVLVVDWKIDSLKATAQAVWRAEDDWGLSKLVLGRSIQGLGKVPMASGSMELSLNGSQEDWQAYAVDSKGQKSSIVVFTKPRFGVLEQQMATASVVRSLAQQADQRRREADRLMQRSSEERRRQTQRRNSEDQNVQKQAEEEWKKEVAEQMKNLEKAVQSLKLPQSETRAQEHLWEEKRAQIEKLLEEMQREQSGSSPKQTAQSLERMEALLQKLLEEQEQLLAIQSLERLADEQSRLAQESRPDEQRLQEEIAQETAEINDKQNAQSLDQAQKMEDALRKQSNPKNSDQAQAAEALKKSAAEMRNKLNESQQSKTEDEIKSLKQLIDNLLQVSFGLERLADRTSVAVAADPNYALWQKELQRLQEGTRLIGDTLRAIGMRRPDIGSKTSEHVENMQLHAGQTKNHLKERQGPQASVQLQKSMKEANDLAVLFQEALNQAQQQLSNMKKDGTGSCSKPGSGKPSASGMRKMQGSLAEQMKSLGQRPGQQSGTKPGTSGKPEGEGGTSGKDGNAAQRASLLAQQERLRRELERSKGGSQGGREAVELMKDLERQLIKNADISRLNQTLKKLDIKLLELERAEKQEEEDSKRVSEQGRDRRMEEAPGSTVPVKPSTQSLYRGWPLFRSDYIPPQWPSK